jgi:hypothetical protein
MNKLLLVTLLIFLSVSYSVKAHEPMSGDHENDDGEIDHGSDEGMTFSDDPNHEKHAGKFDEVVTRYLGDNSKVWTKAKAQQVYMEYFAHLSPKEYKYSVEDFLESHSRDDLPAHASSADLMNAHQIRHYVDYVFGTNETKSNDELKANLDIDMFLEWLDTLSEDEHKAYEEFTPSHDTLYHEEMDFDM